MLRKISWFCYCSLIAISFFVASDDDLTVIFGGDVSFTGVVRYNKQTGRCAYNTSFKTIKPYLADADEVVVNLEGVVCDECLRNLESSGKEKIQLLSETESLKALNYAGISIVSMANNHMVDYHDQGMKSTMDALDKQNIQYFGIHPNTKQSKKQTPVILERKDLKLGLLSYCYYAEGICYEENDGLTSPVFYDRKQAIADVKDLNSKVDIIIVLMHWGEEYVTTASGVFMYKEICDDLHQLVDVIIGSHAHVTQPHFYYKDTLIAPQMGNFMFGMHITSFFLFEGAGGPSNMEDYEKWWFKMTKRFKNRAAFGRMYKLAFNENGLIKEDSRYMETVSDVDDNHCLFVRPVDDTWRYICSDDDVNCGGTTDCNQWECKVGNKWIKYDDKLIATFEKPISKKKTRI